MDIKMVSVFVHDLVKAHGFYTGALGFQSLMFESDYMRAIVDAKNQSEGVVPLLEPTFSEYGFTDIFEDGFDNIILIHENQ